MVGADCTRASSTESPTLERGSVQDVRTFSGTLSPNIMICCDRVVAGMTTKRQQIAGVINTFMYVNHDLSLIGEILMACPMLSSFYTN